MGAPRAKAWCFTLLALAAFLLLAEGAARVYQYGIRHRTLQDAIFSPVYRHYYFLGNAFKPGSGGPWQALGEIRINRLGYRGPEIALPKPEGVTRVVAVGASTSHAGGYVTKLADLIRQDPRYADRDIEIINAAVPAWNTTQSLIDYVTRSVYLEPDLLLVYHGVNDAFMTDYHWLLHPKEVEFTKFGGWLRNHSMLYAFTASAWEKAVLQARILLWRAGLRDLPLSNSLENLEERSTQVFETNLEQLLTLARSRGTRVLLITMVLNHDPGDTAAVRRHRAGYQYPEPDFFARRVGEMNARLREIAARQGAELLDAAASDLGGDPGNFVDLCHFSERGGAAFARLVKEAVDRMLPSALTPVQG